MFVLCFLNIRIFLKNAKRASERASNQCNHNTIANSRYCEGVLVGDQELLTVNPKGGTRSALALLAGI